MVLLFASTVSLSPGFGADPESSSAALIARGPISIIGNENFTAANGVIGGDGTEANPYIIAGWQIGDTPGEGISIRDTDAHFGISDVSVQSAQVGIYLGNVMNGRIENATLAKSDTGITLVRSSRIAVVGSSIVSNNDTGIFVFLDSLDVSIAGNLVSNNGRGITLAFSDNVTIERNQIEGNREGVVLFSAKNATISSNGILDNGNGILLDASEDVRLLANNFTSNGVYLSGHDPGSYASHVIGSDNLVNGKPLRYYANCSGVEVDGIPVGQLIVANCSNIRIANLDISDTDVGVQMAFVDNVEATGINVSRAARFALRVERSSNFTILNSTLSRSGVGASIWASRNGSLIGNEISANGYGVLLRDSRQVSLEDNIVLNNSLPGVDMRSSTQIAVQGNRFVGRTNGIRMDYVTYATITRNSFDGDGLSLSDAVAFRPSLAHFNTHVITPDNTVNGKPLYYYRDCTSIEIDGIPVGQLIVANCTGLRIANVTVENTAVGIQVAFAEQVQIADSAISGNKFGVQLYESRNVSLTNIDTSWNDFTGISLGAVSNGAIIGSSASNNRQGITVLEARNISVERTTAASNENYGIGLGAVSDIVVRANSVWDNGKGIFLVGGTEAIIVRNSVSYNEYGIFLGSFTGARVYHNTLIDNRVQAFDDGGANAWDAGYPTGGNLWSDYSGVDRCTGPAQDVCPAPDRIGDAPYVIDADTLDRYPILVPADTLPAASFTVTPERGDVTSYFWVDASNSTDPLDAPGLLEVRWDWEADGVWNTPWMTQKLAQHRYVEPGVYTIQMEVRNTRGMSALATRQVFVSPDATPPRIEHRPDGTAIAGQAITITTTVTDAGGVQLVLLYYRPPGDTEFAPVLMSSEGDDAYSFQLPPLKTIGALLYYIIAVDNAGNLARSPDTGNYVLEVEGGEVLPEMVVGVILAAVTAAGAGLVYLLHRQRRGKAET